MWSIAVVLLLIIYYAPCSFFVWCFLQSFCCNISACFFCWFFVEVINIFKYLFFLFSYYFLSTLLQHIICMVLAVVVSPPLYQGEPLTPRTSRIPHFTWYSMIIWVFMVLHSFCICIVFVIWAKETQRQRELLLILYAIQTWYVFELPEGER